MLELDIFSPVSGAAVPLSDVPDKTFSDELLGPGIAVVPSNGRYCSPIDGTLSIIAGTLHAFCIRADNGIELLVHIGIDTVNLHGAGFKCHAAVGDRVKRGDPIISVNTLMCRRKNLNLISPCIVLNAVGRIKFDPCYGPSKAGSSLILSFSCSQLEE